MGNTLVNLNDPIWLDNTEPKDYQIPLEVFPVQIQNIITDYSKYLNYPVEFTAASIVALTSVTMGNQLELEVERGWNETAVLYTIIIQNRGMGKSHPMRAIFNPLFAKERQFIEKYQEEMEDYKRDLKDKEIPDPEPPLEERISITKFTPEVLYKIHCNNPKGIIVWTDEAKAWFGCFNQHSKNADEQMWLDIYNGGHLTRDTITHGNQYIPKAFVSILGGIQPMEIVDFVKKNTENGLVDRILFTYPDYLKMKPWSRDEIPLNTILSWKNIYECMYESFEYTAEENVQKIKYDPDAYDIVYEWDSKVKSEANSSPENTIFAGIVAKAGTNIHRLAMILEALECACNGCSKVESISTKSAAGAVKLIEYFIEEALKVRKLVSAHSLDDKDKWYNLLKQEFTTAEAVDVGVKIGISQRAAKNWLNEDERIQKVKHGFYQKLI